MDRMPRVAEIRQEINETLRQLKYLRRLLRLSQRWEAEAKGQAGGSKSEAAK